MVDVSVPGKLPRHKQRAYTRRYLRRALQVQADKVKAQHKAARLARQAVYVQQARVLAAFKGCDPERTLALIGQEAHG